MKRTLFIAMLLVAVVIGCGKKSEPSDNQPAPQPTANTGFDASQAMNTNSPLFGWLKYAGPDHKFTVMLPSFPTVKEKSDQSPQGEMQVHIYASQKDASTGYSVACYDFPPIHGDPKMFLARLEEVFIKGQDAKVTSYKPIQVGDYYGTQFEFVAGGQANYSGTCRLILVGQRAYALAVVHLNAVPQPADCDAFFDSLAILQN